MTPALDGRLGRDDDGRWTLTSTRTLRGEPAVVWEAIVSPAGLAAWAPYAPDRRLDTVGPVALAPVNRDADTGVGRVLGVDAPRRLVLDRGGRSLLHWTLVAADGGTELTLVQVFEDRPAAAEYGAGWEVCLDALGASEQPWPHAPDPRARRCGKYRAHERLLCAVTPTSAGAAGTAR